MSAAEKVVVIRRAKRSGARLVIAFAGGTGSGKTRSAIEFGYGLANFDANKLGFLDTENKRGSLYADVLLDHPTHPTTDEFLIGDLYAPFSPERYTEALEQFQAEGVEVVIIDSVSHEWEGVGGCEEIADAAGAMGWKVGKKRHKKFVNKMLAMNMHVIVCVRARGKMDFTDKRNPIDIGIQPICEKNFMYEMTASLMMHNEGKRQDVLKCPGALLPFLGRAKGFITSADGKAVRDWVDSGKPLDPEVEKARNTLQAIANDGTAKYKAAWKATAESVRIVLQADGTHDTMKRAAADADTAKAADSQSASDLESKIGGAE